MFTAIKVSIAFAAVIIGVQLFLPLVTELPFGMDAALIYFLGMIRGFMEIMPWIVVPFSLVVLAFFIKGLHLLWAFVRYMLSFIH